MSNQSPTLCSVPASSWLDSCKPKQQAVVCENRHQLVGDVEVTGRNGRLLYELNLRSYVHSTHFMEAV